MAEYIEKQAVLDEIDEEIQEFPECEYAFSFSKRWIKKLPPADVRPVVLCKDCRFWRDRYIKQNDGVERKYTDKDVDALGIKDSVTLDVGVNVGAMCRYEDGRGWRNDKSVFRNKDDFCSRGELRPCSYDEWWGIIDGVYPSDGADMRGGEQS